MHELEPNREHNGADGGSIVATDRELIYLDRSGAVLQDRAERPTQALHSLAVRSPWRELARATLEADFGGGPARPTVATKGDDDKIIDTYIGHAKLAPQQEREVRAMWQLFRELCPGVKLKDATRDHGRRLAGHLKEKGNKSATIEKKISWLNAAVNFAIKEGTLKFNPFASVVPKSKDALRRLPFSANDMRIIRDNLDKLPRPINS